MIAVLKHGTTKHQLDHLVAWLKAMDLDVHISEGSQDTVLGLIGDTSRVDMDLLALWISSGPSSGCLSPISR